MVRFKDWLRGCCVAAALPLLAQDPPWDINFSAFGTLGAAESSTNQVGFRRDIAQPDGVYRKPNYAVDSRFGAQMSIKLDPSLFTTFQVISRYRYDGSYHPDLSEACVTWLPAPGLQLRGGLVNVHETTTGEYLDAGYTYLWARPPVEAYGLTPLTKYLGIDFLDDLHLGGDTTLETELYAGRTVEKAQIDHVGPFDLSGGDLISLSLKIISGPWKYRLVGGTIKSGRNLPQPVPTIQGALSTFGTLLAAPELFKAADSLNVQGTGTWALTGSVVYEDGPWQGQAFLSSGSSSAYLTPGGVYGYTSLATASRTWCPTASTRATIRPAFPTWTCTPCTRLQAPWLPRPWAWPGSSIRSPPGPGRTSTPSRRACAGTSRPRPTSSSRSSTSSPMAPPASSTTPSPSSPSPGTGACGSTPSRWTSSWEAPGEPPPPGLRPPGSRPRNACPSSSIRAAASPT